MKFVFLLGGMAGFLVGAGTDFFSGRSPDRILFDGAVGCLAGALLFRWFWTVLVRGVRETLVNRQTAAAEAATSKAK
jgi:hypothetical protein